MTMSTHECSKSRFQGVSCLLWGAAFSWAVSSMAAETLDLSSAAFAVVFSTILLTLYGLFRLAPRRQKLRMRWTWASTIVFAVWYVLYSLFGKVDPDAILFHINHDVGSAEVRGEVLKAAMYAALPFLLLMISWSKLSGMSRGLATVNRILPAGLLALNPLIWIGVQQTFASSSTPPGDLDREYAPPVVSPSQPGSRKNLIHIFMESAERTFWDERRFGDVAQPLKRLAGQGWSANNISQVSLTGWTIAGHVASTCGVPLFSLGVIHSNSFNLVQEFLPEVQCLGDVLQAQGYTNVFIKGASLDFAGTRHLVNGHGYVRGLGYDELHHRFPGRLNTWGLHDEDTLQIAYEQVSELTATGAPYSVTVTTLGGHAPEGHVSPLCGDVPFVLDQPNDTLKAFACSNLLVEELIERLRREGLLENTVVVIQSDHLAMRNEVYNRLEASERRNLFLVLGAERRAAEDKPASAVDIFPTILTALGFDLADDRAGLGRALQSDSPTLVERWGTEGMNRAIDKAHDLRDRLWGIVRNES